MAKDISASTREQSPHVNRTIGPRHANETTRTGTIINTLKRRAQIVLNDKSIDAQSHAIIRYSLETNDPWLAELVCRADAGENITDALDSSQTPEPNEHGPGEERIEALAEIICGAGDDAAAALFALMARLAASTHPKVFANAAKHFAFTRCGELNVYGMVDAQIAVIEKELLTSNPLTR